MTQEYIGVDLHKAFFQACAVTPTAAQWEGRFPRTAEGMRGSSRAVSARAAIAVEASGPTWAFVDALSRGGADLRRRPPEDQAEGRVRGENRSAGCPAARRCVAAGERRRHLFPAAGDSRAARSVPRAASNGAVAHAVAQMIRALLLRCVPASPRHAAVGPARAGWLAACTLPPDADGVAAARATVSRDPRRRAGGGCRGAAAGRGRSDRHGTWTAMVGIGPVMALTIRAEIGDISPFARGPALACYAGLVPRVDRSADRIYHGRITRAGSPWLRWALVEMARHAIKRPDARGPVGAPPGGAEGTVQSACRVGPRAVRPGREHLADRPM